MRFWRQENIFFSNYILCGGDIENESKMTFTATNVFQSLLSTKSKFNHAALPQTKYAKR